MFFPNLMDFERTDLVLEIGPGALPHWRPDCLADKYTPEDVTFPSQFGGERMKTKGKPLFKIDDGKLPFKDNSFDYTICSHVFEHMEEEELAMIINEISRVSKKSYIEFPTTPYDFIYNFPVHTNFMDIIDDTIICFPKKYSKIYAVKNYTDLLCKIRETTNIGFESKYKQLFGVGQVFTGRIKYKIIKDEDEFFSIISPKYLTPLPCYPPSFAFLVKNKLNQWIWPLVHPKKSRGYFNSILK